MDIRKDERKAEALEEAAGQSIAAAGIADQEADSGQEARAKAGTGEASHVLVTAAILLADSMYVEPIDELARKLHGRGVWPSPGKESAAALCSLIDRDIAEKDKWSLFLRREDGQYTSSEYGEGLHTAAFMEADAQGRYIMLRQEGKTARQIRVLAEADEHQHLIELCDGISDGTREEPQNPAPWSSGRERADFSIVLTHRAEKARLDQLRDVLLEPISSRLFDLGRQANHARDFPLGEAVNNAVTLLRDVSGDKKARPSNLAVLYMRRVGMTAEKAVKDQREALVHAAERLGLEVIAEYADDGRSGLSLNTLPQLRMLMKDAEQRRFQHLIIRDISRLSRGPLEHLDAIIEHFRRCGVTVHDPDSVVFMPTHHRDLHHPLDAPTSAWWPDAAAAKGADALRLFMTAVCRSRIFDDWRRAMEYELWLCALAERDMEAVVLGHLARCCGGWWMKGKDENGKAPDADPDERNLKFVPLSEWRTHYDAWLAGHEA